MPSCISSAAVISDRLLDLFA